MYERDFISKRIKELENFIAGLDQHKDSGLYYLANECVEIYRIMLSYFKRRR
jgi:hypothetical protein